MGKTPGRPAADNPKRGRNATPAAAAETVAQATRSAARKAQTAADVPGATYVDPPDQPAPNDSPPSARQQKKARAAAAKAKLNERLDAAVSKLGGVIQQPW